MCRSHPCYAKGFSRTNASTGHYYCSTWGKREHWWLVTSNNEIVDLTVAQFPSKGLGVYVPWDEGAPEPTGMCPECGNYVYDDYSFCSKSCGHSYMAYLNTGCL